MTEATADTTAVWMVSQSNGDGNDFTLTGKPGDSAPGVGYSGTGAGVVAAAGQGKSLLDAMENPRIDLGGFEGGFKDGVTFYFSRAAR